MSRVHRTEKENAAGKAVAGIFDNNPEGTEIKLENFTKYVRRIYLKRFLVMYEIFKLAMPVKGSIIECGVFRGFGIMGWAKLSTILEPENLTRRIYGFDTFTGFPLLSDKDESLYTSSKVGDFQTDSYEEIQSLLKEYDNDRFLGHIPKVELIRGDITVTIPKFVTEHPHLIVSLLFMDADLYEPTKTAIEYFLPRMPKGAIIAFDELDNPIWPGETQAICDSLGLNNLRLRRLEWDPYIAFATID